MLTQRQKSRCSWILEGPGSPEKLREASRGLPGPPGGLPGLPGAPLGLGKSRTTPILGQGKNTHCPPVDKLEIKNKNTQTQTQTPKDIC